MNYCVNTVCMVFGIHSIPFRIFDGWGVVVRHGPSRQEATAKKKCADFHANCQPHGLDQNDARGPP
jgi:hypothetical protein